MYDAEEDKIDDIKIDVDENGVYKVFKKLADPDDAVED